MAKFSFACKDIGMQCPFKTDAPDKQALMGKIADHAKTAHNMATIDAAMQQKVEGAIKKHLF